MNTCYHGSVWIRTFFGQKLDREDEDGVWSSPSVRPSFYSHFFIRNLHGPRRPISHTNYEQVNKNKENFIYEFDCGVDTPTDSRIRILFCDNSPVRKFRLPN